MDQRSTAQCCQIQTQNGHLPRFYSDFQSFFCVRQHCFNEISGSAFVIGGLQGGGGISNVVTKLDSVERKSFKNS